jgi:hypothetical protein
MVYCHRVRLSTFTLLREERLSQGAHLFAVFTRIRSDARFSPVGEPIIDVPFVDRSCQRHHNGVSYHIPPLCKQVISVLTLSLAFNPGRKRRNFL